MQAHWLKPVEHASYSNDVQKLVYDVARPTADDDVSRPTVAD